MALEHTIEPRPGLILLRRELEPQQTASGLVMAQTARSLERSVLGTILRVGEGVDEAFAVGRQVATDPSCGFHLSGFQDNDDEEVVLLPVGDVLCFVARQAS